MTQVLPPGHQELTRRATPTIIMPVEVPHAAGRRRAPPLLTPPPPRLCVVDQPAPLGRLPGRRSCAPRSTRSSGGWAATFAEWEGWDWISDFGDPIAEHHAVREAVGIWDESPLQKWLFLGPDALQAADYCFTNDMAAARGRPGALRRRSATSTARCSATASSSAATTPSEVLVVTALPTDGDHFRRILRRPRRRDRGAHVAHAAPAGAGPALARAAVAALTDADVAGLRYFRFIPHPVTVGGVDGCLVSRTGYSGELGYEIYCPPEGAEQLWQALLDQGASVGIRPYGLAAVESLRIESGLIFIGFDYFPGVTSPYHMNLDRMIKLDKPATSIGKAALQAEHEAGITHRMVTLVIAGEEAPDYDTPVVSARPRRRQAALALGRPLADRRPADRHGVPSRPS